MEKINSIGTDLFNKIRGRFSNVVIGDAEGNVVSDPAEARFFDFEYTSNGLKIGKVSVSVNDDDLTVIYSKDLLEDKPDSFKDEWYEFLREMRKFAKRRLLQFDVRDITKTNLSKRDYQFLANTRGGEDRMNESKMYGTARTSYQKVDNARIVIKHTAPINTESNTARTQHISAIYIESAEGERFKYPYKHLNGARAMARHVSEGGRLYDDFGAHIVSLSEEMHKLRKFKTYMGKSNVMAESLAEYVDVVNNRISEVKKTIDKLQKPAFYREAFDGFETPILEEVPNDVAESWIDQLTIKQFNEELKDVFPYIYRLVGEAKQAEVVALEDIVDEADPCWKGYKQIGMKKKSGKKVPNCVPEEIELEQAFEAIMGQFAEEDLKKKVEEASSDQTSRRPYVKFTEKKLPNGNSVLQVLVNTVAYSPDAFKRSSPDTMEFNVVPPSVNADGKIYHTLDQMMSTLKRKNNTTGITVVIDKSLENILNQKKYKYVTDWLSSKTKAELDTVDVTKPADQDNIEHELIKKGITIFVDVYFDTTGETQTFDGSSLKVLEYLVDTKEENYDGNPFVQGTPVAVVNPDTDRRGQRGVVVRSRKYEKEEKQFYANQKFKDIVAKTEKPYEKIVVTNTKAFAKIRKEQPNLFSKYFKPTLGIFEVPPSELEKFKSVVYSDDFEKTVGNPKLFFLSELESPGDIPNELLKDMPAHVQMSVQGEYGKIDYTDDDSAPSEKPETSTTGPLSVQGFRKLENYLNTNNLRGYLYFTKEEAKQLQPISDAELKTYMEDLMRTRDLKDAKQIAAEILMKQDAFPSERKDRYFDIKNVIAKDSPEDILNFMREWYINMKKHSARPGTPIAAIPGMPAKMPAGNTPPPAPEENAPQKVISQQSFDRLAELVNDKNVILDYTKEVANDILDREYKTSTLSLNMLKNRINQATSKEAVYNIIVDLEQRRVGNAKITKTLRPVIQNITRVKKNPNIRTPFNKSNESIGEAKDYNFTADDIARIGQMSDINAAKQYALKLITADSKRPMTKDKIGYFTNAIQSKKNTDALVKMLYDMLLSGEGHGVIGTASSTKPSRYRQTYGEETVESNIEENWKAKLALLLGLGVGGYHMLDTTSAKNTPLGQSLQAAAEQGDERAARYLSQLDGLIDANNNGAIQHIARQYPPANESKAEETKSKKTPFTEFIMSHYDRNTNQIPKGETAVLTMIEKEYGEKYIEPAKQFIERLTALHDQYQMQTHPQKLQDNSGLDRIKSLAGL